MMERSQIVQPDDRWLIEHLTAMVRADSGKSVTENLENEAFVLAFIEAFVEEVFPVLHVELRDKGRGHFEEFSAYSQRLALKSAKHIFDHSDSPIQKVLLNALNLQFLLGAPSRLVVFPPNNDASETLERQRENLKFYLEIEESFRDSGRPYGHEEFHSFLSTFHRTRHLAAGEHERICFVLREYVERDHRNSVFAIVEASFPRLSVDSKSVRSDCLLYVPSMDFQLALEFDGYEFHSDRASFVRDRKKDRALSDARVLTRRYSGKEINEAPFKASFDVAKMLLALVPGMSKPV
jgi:hypothetical protein